MRSHLATKCYNREATAFCTPQVRVALEVAFKSVDKREAQWLTKRLLWAIPWPKSDVSSDVTAARVLVTVFGRTIHALRPLADAWVTWSHKWTCRFGAAWAALLRLPQLQMSTHRSSSFSPPSRTGDYCSP